MKVVVIDGILSEKEKGIATEYYYIENSKMLKCNSYANYTSHATICDLIISQYGQVESLININILGKKDSCDICDLICALKWCYNRNIDLINISAGLVHYVENSDEVVKVSRLCDILNQKGVRIIAAQDNDGYITIPAKFTSVISVETINALGKTRNKFRHSNIFLKGTITVVQDGKIKKIEKCNSFSCAMVTAMLTMRNDIKRVTIFNGLFIYKNSKDSYSIKNGFLNRVKSEVFWKFQKIELPTICVNIEDYKELIGLLKYKFQKNGYVVSIVTDSNQLSNDEIYVLKNKNHITEFSRHMKTDLIIYVVFNKFPNDCLIIKRSGSSYLLSLENFDCFADKNNIFEKVLELLTNN